MIVIPTKLTGAFVLEPERIEDDRGFFARIFCKNEFKEKGLCTEFVQSSVAFNKEPGTLRGMHFQAAPHFEIKLVRCTMGAVLDVIIDLRPDSSTFKQWVSVELSAENRKMVYVPKGFAHGYQTLVANSEIEYHMSEYYRAPDATGVRWDDSAFGIRWPETAKRILSAKDKAYPDFEKSKI